MVPRKVNTYIKLMRKQGVTKLKVDGLEIELGHEPEPQKVVVEPLKDVQDEPAYSEEDILFWSTQSPPSDPTNN